MKLGNTLTLVAVTALASASPLRLKERGQVCNTPPTAVAIAQVQPLQQPSCDTAELCLQACEANSQCQSFAFGLPPSASTPKCLIFSVPAAQVPPQDTNVNVFDKACASVPNTPPTKSAPIGVYSAIEPTATSYPSQNNGHETTGQNTQSNTQGTNGQKAQDNVSPVNTPIPTPSNTSREWVKVTQRARSPMDRRAVICGSTPSGPSTNPPAPFTTNHGVANAEACLALCQRTIGCKS